MLDPISAKQFQRCAWSHNMAHVQPQVSFRHTCSSVRPFSSTRRSPRTAPTYQACRCSARHRHDEIDRRDALLSLAAAVASASVGPAFAAAAPAPVPGTYAACYWLRAITKGSYLKLQVQSLKLSLAKPRRLQATEVTEAMPRRVRSKATSIRTQQQQFLASSACSSIYAHTCGIVIA